MGLSTHYYICNNETVKKVAAAKMFRFYSDESKEFPEYANETLKIAEFTVEVIDRKVQEVFRSIYSLYHISGDGSINQEMKQLSLETAVKKTSQNLKFRNDNIIDASYRFQEKSLNKKLIWTPSDKVLEKLTKQIFG